MKSNIQPYYKMWEEFFIRSKYIYEVYKGIVDVHSCIVTFLCKKVVIKKAE
jgi:hypothetical protein